MTATPKETEYVSNSDYFGPPVYTYSLKQGIRDGFLAPYKVIKVHLDVDVEGYRPMPGEVDQYGHEIEDRLYNQKDFDPFDLICHIAFDQPPLTRRERADQVRKRDIFTKFGPQARAVLEALLVKYQDEGVVGGLDNVKLLEIAPFNEMGTPIQLIQPFGNKAGFEHAVHELQASLYQNFQQDAA